MAPALGFTPSMMAFMMVFFWLVRLTMSTSSFSFTSSTPRKAAAPLHAGALCVDHRAAACTGGAGSVHNGAGVALICHHQQQFIAGILQGALLLPCKGLVLGEEHQCPFAADAAQRHNERNAGARHIDLHFAAQILLDLLPAFCSYHGQQHRLQRLQKLFPQLGE